MRLLYTVCFFLFAIIIPNHAQDDFYTPPAGYESSAPGTILKSRPIRPGFRGIFPTLLSIESYQLLYRSTAVDGSPLATVTTIFVPWNAPRDRMVAFDVFEDSSASQCAPSRNFVLDGTSSNLLVQINVLILQAYLLKGWIVAVADDEGPESAFGAGRLAGKLILDGIRAVKSFEPVGLQEDAMIVGTVRIFRGAIGMGWAASLKESYANELNVVGWALGGTPANLTGTFVNIDGQLFAGFIPAAIAGLSTKSAYPRLQSLIDSVATEKGKQDLQFSRSKCALEVILRFRYERFQTSDFSTFGDQLLYNADVIKVLNENSIGSIASETPKAPVYMYHSTLDGVIPMSNATASRDTWCKSGAKVHFDTYLDGGHGGTAIIGLVKMLDFVERAFNGDMSDTCTQETIQPTPLSLPLVLEPLFIGLFNILQRLGSGDVNLNKHGAQVLASTVSTTVKDT